MEPQFLGIDVSASAVKMTISDEFRPTKR